MPLMHSGHEIGEPPLRAVPSGQGMHSLSSEGRYLGGWTSIKWVRAPRFTAGAVPLTPLYFARAFGRATKCERLRRIRKDARAPGRPPCDQDEHTLSGISQYGRERSFNSTWIPTSLLNGT